LYIPLFFLFFFFLCIPTKVYYDYCATESFLSRVPSSSVLEDVSEVCSLLLHLWSHGWCVFLLLCSSLFISVLVCVLVLARARAKARERLHRFSFKFAAKQLMCVCVCV
jgi:hypothetical protein